MDEERQSLETKRKILKKLKKLLNEWNGEFESMDPDVRHYFDKVDKDLKHLDKNLKAYFEKLSKEFEIEEKEFIKAEKARKKAERQKAKEAGKEEAEAEETETMQPDDETSEWVNDLNQPVATTSQGANAAAAAEEDEEQEQTQNEKRVSQTHISRHQTMLREAVERGPSTRSGIIDMRALFEEAVAACRDSENRH